MPRHGRPLRNIAVVNLLFIRVVNLKLATGSMLGRLLMWLMPGMHGSSSRSVMELQFLLHQAKVLQQAKAQLLLPPSSAIGTAAPIQFVPRLRAAGVGKIIKAVSLMQIARRLPALMA